MKKLLSILGTILISSTSTSSIVACSQRERDKIIEDDEIIYEKNSYEWWEKHYSLLVDNMKPEELTEFAKDKRIELLKSFNDIYSIIEKELNDTFKQNIKENSDDLWKSFDLFNKENYILIDSDLNSRERLRGVGKEEFKVVFVKRKFIDIILNFFDKNNIAFQSKNLQNMKNIFTEFNAVANVHKFIDIDLEGLKEEVWNKKEWRNLERENWTEILGAILEINGDKIELFNELFKKNTDGILDFDFNQANDELDKIINSDKSSIAYDNGMLNNILDNEILITEVFKDGFPVKEINLFINKYFHVVNNIYLYSELFLKNFSKLNSKHVEMWTKIIGILNVALFLLKDI